MLVEAQSKCQVGLSIFCKELEIHILAWYGYNITKIYQRDIKSLIVSSITDIYQNVRVHLLIKA
jgi:hypothetical protein